jgi:hypothetical protein
VDRLGQLFCAHLRKADLLHDDRVAGHAGRHVRGLDLARAEQALDRVDHGAGVHDGPVDDGLGRQGLDSDVHELVFVPALATGFHLDGLDGRRADVEADESFRRTEQSHGRLSLEDVGYVVYPLSSVRLEYRRRVPPGDETCQNQNRIQSRTYEE